MHTLRSTCRFGLAATMLFAGAQVLGSPEFEFGSGTSMPWTQALQGIPQGRVRPVIAGQDTMTFVAQEFYLSQGGPFVMQSSVLFPDYPYEGQEALMMGWEPPTIPGLAVAAWQFDYAQDPSLFGRRIRFTVNAPPGIWDVSLELIDANGFSRGWFLPMPPLGWNIYEINPEGGTPPPGWVYADQPGFDLTQVVSIRLNESGRQGVFPAPPPGVPFPPFFQWNAWDSLRVIRPPIQTTVPGLIVSPFAGSAAGLPPLASPKFGLIATPGASPFIPEMYIDQLGSPEIIRIDPIGNPIPFTNPFPMPSPTFGLDLDGLIENLKSPTLGLYGGPAAMYGVPAGGAPLQLVRPNGAWGPFGLPTGNVPGAAQAQFDRTPGFRYGGFLYLSDWGPDATDGIYRSLPNGATMPFAPMPNLDVRYFTFDLTAGATGYLPGNLWATSYNSGQVFSITPVGAVVPRFVLAPGIEGLAFGTGQDLFTNELYVANLVNGTVDIVDPNGVVRPFINGLPGAAYLMFVDTGPYAFRGNPSLYILDGRSSIWVVYHCLADVDDGSFTGTPDAGVTIDDLLWYLWIFELGVIQADVDDGSFTGTRDGGVTIDDLLYYLHRFELGC